MKEAEIRRKDDDDDNDDNNDDEMERNTEADRVKLGRPSLRASIYLSIRLFILVFGARRAG